MATLLLRLAAPLQSWGADSKFETRKTGREPTKSGVVGLLAAALGVRRDDTRALEPLNRLRFGVRVDQEGALLMDYHTANNPRPDEVKKARKKGQKIQAPYVTRRYYLADAVFLVGLESEDRSLLEQLQWALSHPAYPLFLGRRSCPPTLPLCLGIRPGSLLDALRAEPSLAPAWQRKPQTQTRIVADAGPSEAGAVPRRDLPLSFSPIHRQFGYRPVQELPVALPTAVPAEEETTHDPFAELR